MRDLSFEADGAALHKGAALSVLGELETAIAEVSADQAGVRLYGIPALGKLLTSGPIGSIGERYMGRPARPVRAILFDKAPTANWALGWHQDRTIAVRARHDIAGYGPWSVKRGVQHVEPPFAVIEAMVTLRIHFDEVTEGTAPLLIAPGSHRLGKIASNEAARTAEHIGMLSCLAQRGDVWSYSTPILHASNRSTGTQRRRVLQVDLSPSELPAPLAWLGL